MEERGGVDLELKATARRHSSPVRASAIVGRYGRRLLHKKVLPEASSGDFRTNPGVMEVPVGNNDMFSSLTPFSTDLKKGRYRRFFGPIAKNVSSKIDDSSPFLRF